MCGYGLRPLSSTLHSPHCSCLFFFLRLSLDSHDPPTPPVPPTRLCLYVLCALVGPRRLPRSVSRRPCLRLPSSLLEGLTVPLDPSLRQVVSISQSQELIHPGPLSPVGLSIVTEVFFHVES